MGTLIQGARLIDPASGLDQVQDLWLADGRIQSIGSAPQDFRADEVIDARGRVVTAGLVDLASSLREPGYGRKGSIASETLAAASGGITSLCCMPMTKPVLDTPAVAELILDQAQAGGSTRVYPLGALTQGLEGEQLAELVTLRQTGCIAFTNGLNPFGNTRNLRRAMEYAATFDLTVIFFCQDPQLAEGGLAHEGAAANFLGLNGIPETAETTALAQHLLLVEASGVRAHFSQLTCARSVEMIEQAQARGLPVTADVALYQLLLTDAALYGFSSLYHVQPPLRSLKDREGLREGVKAGVIGAIASHHQPHELDAKKAPFANTEPGISSADIFLPLGLSLVEEGLLDLPTLLERMSHGPARIMGLSEAGRLQAGVPADLILFDPAAQTQVGEDYWHSKGTNCPFWGQLLPGRVEQTLLGGRVVIKR